MDEAKSGPDKRAIVDALVLACAHSRIRDIVGTDALRSVLDVEFRELVADGTFNLQPVWELFEDQPGFDPEHGAAPLCRFKSWERAIGIEVTLPSQLRNLSEAERAKHAEECDVPTAELQKVLRGITPEDQEAAAAAKKAAERARRVSQADMTGETTVVSHRHTIVVAVATVIALGCFALSGTLLYRACVVTPDYDTFAIPFAGDIPVSESRRFGPQVRATVTDLQWLGSAREARRQQLEEALRRLESHGVRVLAISDSEGTVRAVAQLSADGQTIRVSFK